jgi:UDP-N-acetylmuramate dehydrogenase
MKDILLNVEFADSNGEYLSAAASDLSFGYRTSALLDGANFILAARMQILERTDPSLLRRRVADHLAERRRRQPLAAATAGSTFRAAPDGTPAGKLIDEAGLKGFTIGGARVSFKHANWIENHGEATASDILELILHVQQVVRSRFGVELQPEVRIL